MVMLAKGLHRELKANKAMWDEVIRQPRTAQAFKLDFYYNNIKHLEGFDDDLIAKIVILYGNFQLFRGQKMSAEDASIQSAEIRKVTEMLGEFISNSEPQ